ncbi:DUF1489 family protein [Segnochrobactraceae bacterium EtOH-i3]
MPLHLVKLCVGVDSFEDLAGWIAAEQAAGGGQPVEDVHRTRMMPKRADEILDGGSLYWVIRGRIQVRQRILALRAETGADGVPRCAIVLEPELVPVVPRQHRPFQGWRYLAAADAPADLARAPAGIDEMPAEMRAALADLGLL